MNSPEIRYLQEVLGLYEVVVPSSARTSDAIGGARASQQVSVSPFVFVLTPFQLSPAELELVNKMLAAANVKEAVFFNQNSHKLEDIEKNVFGQERVFGLNFGLNPLPLPSVVWLDLPAISQFLETADKTKLEKIKRVTWEKLKKLKIEAVIT